MSEELLPFCECGKCGLRVTKKGNRFILGHQNRGLHHSPETCAKMSAAKLGVPHTTPAQIAADEANAERMRGVPLSPKICTTMSVAQLDKPRISPAQIAADKAMRDGNDIVNHHYIYDHSDLSLNTIQMTRPDHMKLHRLLQKLGYIVPHINQ